MRAWIGAVAMRLRKRRLKVASAHVVPDGEALLKGMGWHHFEHLVAEGFRQRGYAVSETGGSGARPVDMVLTRGHDVFLVDCKPWRSKAVGLAPVRELDALVRQRGAAGGFVITSGGYTPDALRHAATCRIELIDGVRLHELLRTGHEKTQPVVVRRAGPFPDSTLPPSSWRLRPQPCPLCGGAMVERELTQGPQAGQRVLACSHYPLCEGTREL